MPISSGVITAFGSHFAILVYGREIELFTELLTYLAVISIIMWSIVLLSTMARFIAHLFYKPRLQRKPS
jgi:hypothetical protein